MSRRVLSQREQDRSWARRMQWVEPTDSVNAPLVAAVWQLALAHPPPPPTADAGTAMGEAGHGHPDVEDILTDGASNFDHIDKVLLYQTLCAAMPPQAAQLTEKKKGSYPAQLTSSCSPRSTDSKKPVPCARPACAVLMERTGPQKLCSRCKGVRYCSRECQRADWKRHKKCCRQLME
jgi:hypothetical protein